MATSQLARSTTVVVVGVDTKDLFWDRVRLARQFLRGHDIGISRPKIRAWVQLVGKVFVANGVGERQPIRPIVVANDWLWRRDQEWQRINAQLQEIEFNRWCTKQRKISRVACGCTPQGSR